MAELFSFHSHNDLLGLRGEFELRGHDIHVRFELRDPGRLLVDSLHEGEWKMRDLQRADGLWQSTCFEAFWGRPHDKGYWELNLSADGRWNLYHFIKYREPQPPKACQDFPLKSITTTPGSLHAILENRVRLNQAEASLCAVLKTKSATHYYSSKHAGEKADFHLRESFILERNL